MRAPPSAQAAACGFLVLDKPAGLTSHACVARVRRRFGLRRVGHGGTLDPAVTGVLPLALGAATRLLPYLPQGKAYRGVVQLGLRTDSDDLSGVTLAEGPVPLLSEAALQAALQRFRGTILQRSPEVSAVHVAGERAYARARRGEPLELEPRTVTIERLELLAWDPVRGLLELAVRCGSGTYIRALARDLGAALGCGGCLAELRRSEALGFTLEQSIPLERLERDPLPTLIDPLTPLSHLPHRLLEPVELPGWRCGRPLQSLEEHPGGQAVVVLRPDGNLGGMARADGSGWLQPRLVLDAVG